MSEKLQEDMPPLERIVVLIQPRKEDTRVYTSGRPCRNNDSNEEMTKTSIVKNCILMSIVYPSSWHIQNLPAGDARNNMCAILDHCERSAAIRLGK